MIRNIVVFMFATLLGLAVQATLIHSLLPTMAAPDFIVILAFYLGITHKSAGGAVGAFLLGLAGDFATAKFIGPNAAGCVLAFSFVVLLSNRIYAERGPALIVVSFLASVVKSIAALVMIYLYTQATFAPGEVFRTLLWEALFTALVAPLVLRFFRWEQGRVYVAVGRMV